MSDGYAAYLRKSRADMEAERRGEGETLARHERTLVELAERLQLPLGAVYREIGSGDTIAARPVMGKLLEEVEAGRWDGVLVMEVERLARGDTMDQGRVARAFRMSGAKIVTPSKTYDPDNEADEEYFEFGLFMSRREYKAINRRLQRGRAASVREGKYAGSTPPYGYDRKKLDDEKGYILVPNPEQAPIVKLIFTLYALGERVSDGARVRLGVTEIARRLNALRVPAAKGGAWSPGSVRELLRNPVYMGCLRWNWRKERRIRKNGKTVVTRPRSPEGMTLAPGRHEALITPELFSAARERFERKRAPSTGTRNALRNPLAGLVLCGKCGRRMQRRPYEKRGRPPSLICTNPDCGNVSAELALVETRLLDALERWLGNRCPVPAREVPDVESARRKAVAKLAREIDALSGQKAALHDLLERGVYDADTFRERARVVAERLRDAERERNALADGPERAAAPERGTLREVYAALTPAGQNELLKALLEKATYRKEPDARRTCPDAFALDLYPKIPPYSCSDG